LAGPFPLALGIAAARTLSQVATDMIQKLLIWIVASALVILAMLLPVIVVTGMFGGQPLAGSIALIGLVLLAFGVAWYVRTHRAGM
jgi:hypothetical protein